MQDHTHFSQEVQLSSVAKPAGTASQVAGTAGNGGWLSAAVSSAEAIGGTVWA